MKYIVDEYFEWMYDLVCNDIYGNKSFHKLLDFLYATEFVPTLDRDQNRAHDGIALRYRFGFEKGYSRDVIDYELSGILGPCTILEMMVALSNRIEEGIMDDPDYGDRTGQWFWNMIVSLGLVNMSDDNFDEYRARDIVIIFINREYSPNGKGGLFTLEYPRRDLRTVEIWYQAMWYLDEKF